MIMSSIPVTSIFASAADEEKAITNLTYTNFGSYNLAGKENVYQSTTFEVYNANGGYKGDYTYSTALSGSNQNYKFGDTFNAPTKRTATVVGSFTATAGATFFIELYIGTNTSGTDVSVSDAYGHNLTINIPGVTSGDEYLYEGKKSYVNSDSKFSTMAKDEEDAYSKNFVKKTFQIKDAGNYTFTLKYDTTGVPGGAKKFLGLSRIFFKRAYIVEAAKPSYKSVIYDENGNVIS